LNIDRMRNAALVLVLVCPAASAWAEDCHPALNPAVPQYMVGYGSLMQTASKLSTEPDAGISLPVVVTGFQRSWSTHGVAFPTTYLGVQPSRSARMAAALYRAFLKDGKLASDAREISYCRVAVAPGQVEMLDASSLPSPSQIWIYVNKPETLAAPDSNYPIVQSYVDIFITGCLELQDRVADAAVDFVEACVRTTGGWSEHWVNDRPMPRRPYQYQPRAFEIDKHLQRLLPELYGSIEIE
jgi:hypothetical protein